MGRSIEVLAADKKSYSVAAIGCVSKAHYLDMDCAYQGD